MRLSVEVFNRTLNHVARTKETRQRARKLGARIAALRIAKGLSQKQLGTAYLQSGESAIRNIESGLSGSDSFIKFEILARALDCTPNDILEIKSEDREVIRGLLEGIAMAFRLPLEQAVPLADIILAMLDSPDIRNTGSSLRDSARNVGAFQARQFLRKLES